MKSFNPSQFRAQFPALNDGTIYLDSAATALKPDAVIDATTTFYKSSGGNVHRSHSAQAQKQTEQYENTRNLVAQYLNVADPKTMVWTRGTTEAINLVAQGFARYRLHAEDEIIVSEAEHHANLVPWLMVAEQTGARVVKWPVNSEGLPDIHLLPGLLTSRSKLLAVGQMSNVTGGQPDLARAIKLAHQAGAYVVVDGAQGIVHNPPDLTALDCDFYAFSAHKLYGPTGLGVLYGKAELLADMSPLLGGGKMITDVSFAGFTTQPAPWRFEAGTPNIAGVAGLNAALQWLEHLDTTQAEAWACQLADSAAQQLAQRPGVRLFRAPHASLFAFTVDGLHHSDIATLLSSAGIALRAGQHCAQPLLAALGVSGTLRVSFAPYNTPDDVAALVAAFDQALSILLD
ncbi:cysteine desulfurase CsdA [Mangrovibacter yixingensis]|uniref:cysteine desulfurase CsdA n=1 Tax=Mangrovibacter yixingensis TaxID=1529639 RepID=UPI001CFCA175|nr:cysteine desulfurase CsdA [Mangrovibacter yixingensis]